MFTTLYGKLAAVLLGLLCLIGGLYIFLTMMTTRLYDQEVTQKLNRALAQNLVAENMRFCREFYWFFGNLRYSRLCSYIIDL